MVHIAPLIKDVLIFTLVPTLGAVVLSPLVYTIDYMLDSHKKA
jgi:hypothetical protein